MLWKTFLISEIILANERKYVFQETNLYLILSTIMWKYQAIDPPLKMGTPR